MKIFFGRVSTRRILPFALAAVAVLSFPRRGWAPTAVEYAVDGEWHGFFLSDVNGESGPFTINNTTQRNRRFGGTLDTGNLMIPYEGTLAASLHFTVVGRGSEGKFVVNHGDLMPNGDDGTAFARSDYRLRPVDGMTDTGSLIFLQDFKATNPPQLSQVTHWQGDVTAADGSSLGMVDVMLVPPDPANRDEKPSFFMGQATLGGMTFPFEVTISDRNADGESQVHALGRNAGVTFTVNGMFMGDSVFEWCINAAFSAEYADGSMLRGTFDLAPVD